MLSVVRTTDKSLIKSIFTHKRLYPHLASDFHPSAEDYEPNPDENVHFLVVKDGEETLGLCIAHPIMSPITWELHHAILPKAWHRTHEIGDTFETWLWNNTPCKTAVGFTPTSNKLALRYAAKHMTQTGLIPQAYQKNGKLYDVAIFTKTRPNMDKKSL